MGFTKLDSGILQSSIMAEPPETFKVFVAILASTGPDGIARISSTFLAAACFFPLDVVDEALVTLEAPDPRSRSLNDDGRRIRRVDGGYFVINYDKYRSFCPQPGDPDSPGAVRTRKWRERKGQSVSVTSPNHGDVSSASASSSASPSTSENKRGVVANFDTWWSHYPKKIAKQDAAKAYAAVVKAGASHEDLLKALDGYLAELRKNETEERFVEHPATFLRAERWRDYLDRPVSIRVGQRDPAAEAEVKEYIEFKKAHVKARGLASVDDIDPFKFPDIREYRMLKAQKPAVLERLLAEEK